MSSGSEPLQSYSQTGKNIYDGDHSVAILTFCDMDIRPDSEYPVHEVTSLPEFPV